MNALQSAARNAADRYFQERMEGDLEFQATLESLYISAVKKFTNPSDTEKLVTKMAERLAAAFSSDRY